MNSPFPIRRRPLSAGQEIDAWCTRCKMDLGHRIVAMVSDAPKRVVCMTCGSEHNYRASKSDEVAKAPRPRAKTATAGPGKTGTRRAIQGKAEWERRVRSGKPFKRYTTEERFVADDLVFHKKFGEGYVVAVHEGKVTVAFSDGERTLVHAAG